MSSTYLTSHDMNMIRGLLREVRTTGELAGTDITAERLLIRRFENGTFNETRLRMILKRHIYNYPNIINEINEWENEGGAVSNTPKR